MGGEVLPLETGHLGYVRYSYAMSEVHSDVVRDRRHARIVCEYCAIQPRVGIRAPYRVLPTTLLPVEMRSRLGVGGRR